MRVSRFSRRTALPHAAREALSFVPTSGIGRLRSSLEERRLSVGRVRIVRRQETGGDDGSCARPEAVRNSNVLECMPGPDHMSSSTGGAETHGRALTANGG
jgi:hypothetical protein